MHRVGVIGAGYVGLTTAACLAHLGHTVHCTDRVPERVAALRSGEIPIREPRLTELVREGLDSGRLAFGTDNAEAARSEFVFLCVPTLAGDDGSPDMAFLDAAVAEVGPHLGAGSIVVNKSTAPIGASRRIAGLLGRDDVSVVVNPEFLREGSAVGDFLHPDRIVVGSDDDGAVLRVSGIFLKIASPIIVTSPESAETIKYAANAFLATKVSFINAIAELCEATGADIGQVVHGVGADRRIGTEFLQPGPGWGGSCLPKDSLGLLRMSGDRGVDLDLLRSAVAVNERQYERVAAKAVRAAGGSVAGKRVALLGCTFKAGTGDVRESPSLRIARRLADDGARVRAYDPTVADPIEGVEICADPYLAAEDAVVLVVGTEWEEFRHLDLDKLGQVMAHRAIVDARNLLDPAKARAAGFAYEGIGFAGG